MKKYGNFLHTEAYRRTFFAYLIIASLFSAVILGFIYRDIYKTARENFLNEAAKVSQDVDRRAGELVQSVDQFSARLYADSALAEDFFRFFGASAEEYTSRRLDEALPPAASVLDDFKALVVRSNYSIRHIICYATENVVDLEFNNQGDSRHRIITTEEAEQICKSGCVYQKDIHRDSTYLGKIAVVVDIARFVDSSLETAPGRGICLVLPDRLIPMGSVKLSVPQASRMLQLGNFPMRYSVEGESLYCSFHPSQVLPFGMVYLIEAEPLLHHLYGNFALLASCFLIAFGAITVVLIRRFSRDTRYISSILTSMEQAEHENFEPLEVPGLIPEYDSIIRALNNLYAHLEDSIQKEYKLTISQQKTQMDMLSVQLSPHFLYNTLERIRMRAVLNHDLDVAEATAGLGLLYRNIVKTDPVIPMSKELEITEEYLNLMTFLYGDQFMYYFDVDPELQKVETPKIWMQPIVENFFKHNFQQDDQIKVVVVELKKTEKGFEGRFFDNIGRLEPERIAEINRDLHSDTVQGKGIGLYNVVHRLRLFYGSGLTITMENNDPTGICIHIICEKEGLNDVSTFDRG